MLVINEKKCFRSKWYHRMISKAAQDLKDSSLTDVHATKRIGDYKEENVYTPAKPTEPHTLSTIAHNLFVDHSNYEFVEVYFKAVRSGKHIVLSSFNLLCFVCCAISCNAIKYDIDRDPAPGSSKCEQSYLPHQPQHGCNLLSTAYQNAYLPVRLHQEMLSAVSDPENFNHENIERIMNEGQGIVTLNTRLLDSHTVLFHAVCCSNLAAVKYILKQKDINLECMNTGMYASYRDKVKERNRNRNDRPYLPDMTPLMYAVYSGNKEIYDELLKFGAKIGTKNSRGYTALHVACGALDYLESTRAPFPRNISSIRSEIVHDLIQKIDGQDLMDKYGRSPIYYMYLYYARTGVAGFGKWLKLVPLIAAKQNLQDRLQLDLTRDSMCSICKTRTNQRYTYSCEVCKQHTCLTCVVSWEAATCPHCRYIDWGRYIIKHPSSQYNISYSLENERNERFKLEIEIIRNVSDSRNFDSSRLEEILRCGQGVGINVNSILQGSTTALFFAVDSDNIRAVHLLLKKGADPNVYFPKDIKSSSQSKKYVTPLMLVVQIPHRNSLDIIDALLANGADINAVSSSGDTALHIASGSFDPPDGPISPLYTNRSIAECRKDIIKNKLICDKNLCIIKDHHGYTPDHYMNLSKRLNQKLSKEWDHLIELTNKHLVLQSKESRSINI